MIAFWSILSPDKGVIPTFWTHLRVPAAFVGLVVMMCTIRLFYWAYLDMADPDDTIQAPVDLPMNVSKIQLPSPSPQIRVNTFECKIIFSNGKVKINWLASA